MFFIFLSDSSVWSELGNNWQEVCPSLTDFRHCATAIIIRPVNGWTSSRRRLTVERAEKKHESPARKKKSEILLIMSGTVTGISEDMDRQIVQVSDPTDLDSTGLVDNGSRLTLTERALTLAN